MISELKIRNFKSLENVDLKLGHFNLLVGANASGKSNFLDALRFLQGVGSYGFSLDEILDGRPPSGASQRWPGIRGGSTFAAFRSRRGTQADKIEFEVGFRDEDTLAEVGDQLTYKFACTIGGDNSAFSEESLCSGDTTIVPGTLRYAVEKVFGELIKGELAPILPKMTLFSLLDGVVRRTLGVEVTNDVKQNDDNLEKLKLFFQALSNVSEKLADVQFLDPLSSYLRGYSRRVKRMSESGEGFAALIHEIGSNGDKPALLEWLKELRPDEISDLYALPGAVNDYMAAVKEGDNEFPASALSDGTLRFIALAAAFFQPSMPKILVIEEIEKGLHPSRLRLLLDLMRSQSKRTGTQVFATTHSPTLLAWLTEEDRKTTFVCARDAESGATKMRSLAEIPRFEELIQEGSHIDELFAEGWLESAPQGVGTCSWFPKTRRTTAIC